MIDVNQLTLNDIKELMEHTGASSMNEALRPLTDNSEDLTVDAITSLQFLIYLMKRAGDLGYTLEQASNISLAEMRGLMSSDTNPQTGAQDMNGGEVSEQRLSLSPG